MKSVLMMEAFAERNGFEEADVHPCLRYLMDAECLCGYSPDGVCPGCGKRRRYLDHARVWEKAGLIVCITSEPYELTDESLSELLEDSVQFRFDIALNTRSWWNPGETLLLDLRMRGGR